MLDFKQFNPGIKTVGGIAGIIATSILAFYLLVIYWPQSDPYESVEIIIPRGTSLSEIGNILKEKNVINNSKGQVPGLGNVPVIGNLFKSKTKTDELDELLIFIAPREI